MGTILIAHKTEYPYLHKSMSRHLDETWVLLCNALYKHLLHGIYNLQSKLYLKEDKGKKHM